eukprot:gnl/TRDRNA2_/TRDRNA2_175872_c0_seq1.p2 gnl/TRDRNA2_/TRDRNA2_175872_c0~~gnl/TRDRNA2_/TRDRNA2_175872_c0_seq1.p2  ORF type:complete len:198 (+),score=28.56 gnl/TRDRNA2_/TRDRNA2_175872_c0_seq1:513-1106(+)
MCYFRSQVQCSCPHTSGCFMCLINHFSSWGVFFSNLIFGVAPDATPDDDEFDNDSRPERVLSIGTQLGFSPFVLELVKQGVDGEKHLWETILSQTQLALCMLARALIANPEVLCVHKPTMCFAEKGTVKIMRLLREFVDKKGVDMNPNALHYRRPRTCFMTSSKMLGIQLADKVYNVSLECGVHSIAHADVTDDMLM